MCICVRQEKRAGSTADESEEADHDVILQPLLHSSSPACMAAPGCSGQSLVLHNTALPCLFILDGISSNIKPVCVLMNHLPGIGP